MFWTHNRRSSSAELHCNLTFSSHQLFTALNAAISISLKQQEEKDEDVNYSGAGQSERLLRDHQHYSNTHTHTLVFTQGKQPSHTRMKRGQCVKCFRLLSCVRLLSALKPGINMCVCVSRPLFRTDEVSSDPDPHQTPSGHSGLKLKHNTSVLQQNTGAQRQHKANMMHNNPARLGHFSSLHWSRTAVN